MADAPAMRAPLGEDAQRNGGKLGLDDAQGRPSFRNVCAPLKVINDTSELINLVAILKP